MSGSRTSETTGTTGQFTGLKCGTTYTLGVDANDAAGKRSARRDPLHRNVTLHAHTAAAELDGRGDPDDRERCDGEGCRELACASTTSNGDKVEDDPGKVEFLVDGNLVLHRDQTSPFGDDRRLLGVHVGQRTASHTFEVRAVNDSGTVLAKNTVTATVANTTTAAAAELDGHDHPDDRERCDGQGCRELACRLRRVTATRSRTTRARSSSVVDGNRRARPRSTSRSAITSASGHPRRSANGKHTFEVRAVNGSGTLIAKNTVTATVANTTTPPPPSSTGAMTQTIANGATMKGVVNWRAVYDA